MYDTVPLSAGANCIRLLQLLPASDTSLPIECHLKVAALDDTPPYEALSYNWGSDDK